MVARRTLLRGLTAGGAAAYSPLRASPIEAPTTAPAPAWGAPTPAQSSVSAVRVAATAPPFQEPLFSHLPRWRGFNLLEKFNAADRQRNAPYVEADLDFMAEWGFDFVRLPTDYRVWTDTPGVYREPPLKEIDQLIAWAGARGIHVNLCLHRAPGYCVNVPKEPLDLWSDGSGGEMARVLFAGQWAMFARRYQGIPSSELSFNLVNEPPDLVASVYRRAIAPAVAAIRAEDPQRLIIADGLQWGRRPVPELAPLQVAQSTRGYDPTELTHYHASWVAGSDTWPVPTWPVPAAINRYLYGSSKPDLQSPLVIQGSFSAGATIGVTVDQVSARADLVVRAGVATIMEKAFRPGAGQGEWKESTYRPHWNDFVARYDQEYVAQLPSAASELRLEVPRGDWLTLSQIRIVPYSGASGGEVVLKAWDSKWAVRQQPYVLDAGGRLFAASGQMRYSPETLWSELVEPWSRLADAGVGIHVGEWGAHRFTPHDVVLSWMSSCLENWRRADMGWALWNLRGDFGVLDSGRSDVAYDTYRGHALDRQMLELLTQG